MKERPIIMSGDNPKLILEGRKTQTRRIIKPRPELHIYHGQRMWGHEQLSGDFGEEVFASCFLKMVPCPYGSVGDRLWVRETWRPANDEFGRAAINYRSDDAIRDLEADVDCSVDDWLAVSVPESSRWRPSIHMPRWASRITLEITKVRVERLQDISHEDCLSEGQRSAQKDPRLKQHEEFPAILNFSIRWDKLHGKGAWDKNPWVWVIEFRKI